MIKKRRIKGIDLKQRVHMKIYFRLSSPLKIKPFHEGLPQRAGAPFINILRIL